MELINDIFLAPYYLFNYIFSLAVWCILVIYSLNWYQEYNGSDWVQKGNTLVGSFVGDGFGTRYVLYFLIALGRNNTNGFSK